VCVLLVEGLAGFWGLCCEGKRGMDEWMDGSGCAHQDGSRQVPSSPWMLIAGPSGWVGGCSVVGRFLEPDA